MFIALQSDLRLREIIYYAFIVCMQPLIDELTIILHYCSQRLWGSVAFTRTDSHARWQAWETTNIVIFLWCHLQPIGSRGWFDRRSYRSDSSLRCMAQRVNLTRLSLHHIWTLNWAVNWAEFRNFNGETGPKSDQQTAADMNTVRSRLTCIIMRQFDGWSWSWWGDHVIWCPLKFHQKLLGSGDWCLPWVSSFGHRTARGAQTDCRGWTENATCERSRRPAVASIISELWGSTKGCINFKRSVQLMTTGMICMDTDSNSSHRPCMHVTMHVLHCRPLFLVPLINSTKISHGFSHKYYVRRYHTSASFICDHDKKL
jgi:hypothetical protein